MFNFVLKWPSVAIPALHCVSGHVEIVVIESN